MNRARLLAELGLGAIAAAVVVTASHPAQAAGDDPAPKRSVSQDPAPPARPPPPASPISQAPAASPAGSSASPAAWSPTKGSRVTAAGVLARAASRRAREREETSPAGPERRRAGAAPSIVSVEIDWHATPQAP